MEIPEACGIQFLDLSGIDEYEKIRVLTSLEPAKFKTKFPWIIGSEKPDDANCVTQSHSNFVPKHLAPLENKKSFKLQASKVASRSQRISIIDPNSGIDLSNDRRLNENHTPDFLPSSTEIKTVNIPVNSQLGSQYFGSTTQYYPSPVVTTIPNIPVPGQPTTHGNFTVPNTSHEIPEKTTIFPTYSPSYPIKTPVYYGVPPAQPIFVSHPATVDVGPYYQDTVSQFQNVTRVENIIHVDDNVGTSSVSQITSSHKNQWVINNSPVLTNVENHSISISYSNLIENTAFKKSGSPLSAETPEFTPKNPQHISSTQNPSTSESPVFEDFSNKIKPLIDIDSQNASSETSIKTESIPQPSRVAGKSWASLFTPKESIVNNAEISGVTNPSFKQIVNMESNLSDTLCPIRYPKKSNFIDPHCYRMAEFLTTYNIDSRAVSLHPRGLINQSNYCYINSILQALIACPPMYNLLNGLSENISSNEKRKPTPVIDGMCKFVKEFKHLPANMRVSNRRSEGSKKDQKKDQGAVINTDVPFEPLWIYKMLNGIHTDLIEGRQEDAEEFLGCLLNNLNDEMLELIKLIKNEESSENESPQKNILSGEDENWQVMGSKNKGSILRKNTFERTPITDIFGGSLKSRIHRTGDNVTENTQLFLTLQLNIEKVRTVREALEALTAKYQLEGVTSSKTNEEVEAWQQVMLDELPGVLVLHLKCFDFKLDGCTKIIKALEFPIDLKIDTKLLSSKTTNAKEKQYKLFAVVYHDGKEATKGHYITDAFHVGYNSWLRYDDASVRQVQEEQVLNPQGTRVPYLLFYRRSNTIRSR